MSIKLKAEFQSTFNTLKGYKPFYNSEITPNSVTYKNKCTHRNSHRTGKNVLCYLVLRWL